MTTAIPTDKSADPSWAWARYQPDSQSPWDLRRAAHLYRRTALAANWYQLQQALADGPQTAIDKLLRPTPEQAAFNRDYDEYERSAAQASAPDAAQAWWLRRLLETPSPLLEQLTLFWHNYFAISNARVANPALMCRYLQQLRSRALGRFDTLLKAVVREPALLVCLEGRANRTAKPNEAFARVLLEQYTLGPGCFSKQDVAEVARAFTGWSVSGGELHFIPREHDDAGKRLLGQEGTFEADDALRILLQQPATSNWVVRRLYRWFISESNPPPEKLLTPLAADFARDYDVARVVETMLRSNLFFSPVAYRQKIKSPVEFALGLIRALQGSVGTLRLGADLGELGQDLYEPPTLKGWAGARCWLNRFTVLGRARLAQALLSSSGPYDGKLDPARAARQHPLDSPESVTRFLCGLLLQDELPPKVRQTLTETAFNAPELRGNAGEQLRHMATLIACLPEFHLA